MVALKEKLYQKLIQRAAFLDVFINFILNVHYGVKYVKWELIGACLSKAGESSALF